MEDSDIKLHFLSEWVVVVFFLLWWYTCCIVPSCYKMKYSAILAPSFSSTLPCSFPIWRKWLTVWSQWTSEKREIQSLTMRLLGKVSRLRRPSRWPRSDKVIWDLWVTWPLLKRRTWSWLQCADCTCELSAGSVDRLSAGKRKAL